MHRLEDNIEMGRRERVCGLDSSLSAKRPLAGCYECGNEPSVGKLLCN